MGWRPEPLPDCWEGDVNQNAALQALYRETAAASALLFGDQPAPQGSGTNPILETGEALPLTRYIRDVLRSAQQNHIWVNAFLAHSDDTALKLGHTILQMLDERSRLLRGDWDDFTYSSIADQQELIVRINKS